MDKSLRLDGSSEWLQIETHDAVSWQAEPHDKLAEVVVLGEQDLPLGMRNPENLLVGRTWARIRRSRDIESSLSEGPQ